MTQLLPPKKEVALALLERSNVDVYLDPRAKGVVVPPQFRKEPRLILKIGLNMPVPIPDLRLDDESMSCTLSFSRTPFFCVVPWPSVFAMVGEDGRGMVWPDDVPQELAVKVVDEKKGPAKAPPDRESAPVAAPRGRRKSAAADEERAPRAKEASSGGKKSRKKKEEGRPVLVAVPAPAAVPVKRSSPTTEEERPSAESVPSVPASRGGMPPRRDPSRPKRELPPYLRVVK
ncbi:MAG: hypothetical protein KF819_27640 [Labilithrix sp.]|nr:hypothetical protein [Labilithrix sp.]